MPRRHRRLSIALAVPVAFAFLMAGAGPASAHRDGCHRWHSCPSDSGSYVCGDLGYTSGCPGSIGSAGTTSTPPPPADSDADGVPDTADVCPTVAAATATGCPLDSDSDGVPDL